jgi:DNA-binding transcriptional LysR family regulator
MASGHEQNISTLLAARAASVLHRRGAGQLSSAISHQIKNLEAGLGVRLFERGTRSLKPTNAGQELYNDIQPLIEDFDRFLRANCSCRA